MESKINYIVNELTVYSHIKEPSEIQVLEINTLCSKLITEIGQAINNKTNYNEKALEEIDTTIEETIDLMDQMQSSFQTLTSDFEKTVQNEHREALQRLKDKVSTLRANYFSN